jgi:shikimate kinase
MTIILTGFMGTGKSTVGRRLADRLNIPFIDTDEEIERLEGRPIKVIFAQDGEPYFRGIERRVIADAVRKEGVIATGGGAIVDAENYERMHAAGPIVCLSSPLEVIVRRTASNRQRPLLHGDDVAERVRRLLKERAPAYARADITIDTSNTEVDMVVDRILAALDAQPSVSKRVV